MNMTTWVEVPLPDMEKFHVIDNVADDTSLDIRNTRKPIFLIRLMPKFKNMDLAVNVIKSLHAVNNASMFFVWDDQSSAVTGLHLNSIITKKTQIHLSDPDDCLKAINNKTIHLCIILSPELCKESNKLMKLLHNNKIPSLSVID